MSAVLTVFRRELTSYFSSAVAYVFIIVFLLLIGAFTFYLGRFYERGQADLQPFFDFHPWLYLVFVPAVTMRLWAEERSSGTIELLLTLPLTQAQAVLGKFLAAWAFTTLTLALTFPVWVTVNYLGSPDNGVVLAGYLGSTLMAGAYLAIGCAFSAASRSQAVAFLLTVLVCLVFLLAGLPPALEPARAVLPQGAVDLLAQFSFLTHFRQIARGVLDARDVVFFVLMIALWLTAAGVIVDLKKSE